MNTWKMSQIAHRCEELLGLTVRQEFNLELIPHILKDMGIDYVSPILDPDQNDFTPANCFWLVAEKEGEPVMIGGVRLDDLKAMNIKRFWDRMLLRTFQQDALPERIDFPSNVLKGRVAYFGDLHSIGAGRAGRSGIARLKLFTAIGHFLTRQDFKPDVTYCFIRECDIERGSPHSFGFVDTTPFHYTWKEPPYPTGSPEWVASLPAEKFAQYMYSIERYCGKSSQ